MRQPLSNGWISTRLLDDSPKLLSSIFFVFIRGRVGDDSIVYSASVHLDLSLRVASSDPPSAIFPNATCVYKKQWRHLSTWIKKSFKLPCLVSDQLIN